MRGAGHIVKNLMLDYRIRAVSRVRPAQSRLDYPGSSAARGRPLEADDHEYLNEARRFATRRLR